MARNEEKQFSKLNRILLQQKKDDFNKSHPKRPKLESLHTVEEIKQWLPSITRDIDINLKQCQAAGYTESKIEEYQQRVLRHEREFKAFVRKLNQLQSGTSETPWTERPYESRKRFDCPSDKASSEIQVIPTPLLDRFPPQKETELPVVSGSHGIVTDMDEPLTFNSVLSRNINTCFQPSSRIEGISKRKAEDILDGRIGAKHLVRDAFRSSEPRNSQNLLGLEYSSSSDSET